MEEQWQKEWDCLSELEKKVLLFIYENAGVDEDIIADKLNVGLLELRYAVDNLMNKKLIGAKRGTKEK